MRVALKSPNQRINNKNKRNRSNLGRLSGFYTNSPPVGVVYLVISVTQDIPPRQGLTKRGECKYDYQNPDTPDSINRRSNFEN